MHVLVTRKSLVEQHPDLPKQLFALFVDAKKRFGKQTLGPPLVWRDCYLSEERNLFNGDAWAYGLHTNAHVLDKFLQYCWSQGIGQHQLTPKELFFESTWELTE
jgi:4,5-dihydroxyphthalate decarboxylase